jgi:hypothetical protein
VDPDLELDPDPHGSALILVGLIRIQKSKKDPFKNRESREISCFEVLDGFF